MVLIFGAGTIAAPRDRRFLMKPPLAAVTASFLRQHMTTVEGHHDVSSLVFAVSNTTTAFQTVGLTFQQEETITVAELASDGEKYGVRQAILMLDLPAGAPKFNERIEAIRNLHVTPQNQPTRGIRLGLSGGGGGGGGGGGLFGGGGSGGGGALFLRASTKKVPDYKNAMKSDPLKVAPSVKVVDDLHGKVYVESGLGGLLTRLLHKHDIQAAKPRAAAQLFEEKGGRFFTVWKDKHGVKIGCFACALHGNNDSKTTATVGPDCFQKTEPRSPGIFMAGSNVNGIGNFIKHCGYQRHIAGLAIFLQGASARQRQLRAVCEGVLSELAARKDHVALGIVGIGLSDGDVTEDRGLECAFCTTSSYGDKKKEPLRFRANESTMNIVQHCQSEQHRRHIERRQSHQKRSIAVENRQKEKKKKEKKKKKQTEKAHTSAQAKSLESYFDTSSTAKETGTNNETKTQVGGH